MDHTPKQWASAAFWLIVKLTLFRLAIGAVALIAIGFLIHGANSHAPWVGQLFGTSK